MPAKINFKHGSEGREKLITDIFKFQNFDIIQKF